jgi:hypothetical protein
VLPPQFETEEVLSIAIFAYFLAVVILKTEKSHDKTTGNFLRPYGLRELGVGARESNGGSAPNTTKTDRNAHCSCADGSACAT